MDCPKPQPSCAAYDYDKQEWIEDKAQAQAQAIAQTREHLELLEGNGGSGYATFIGVDRAQAIREAREALFQLDRAIGALPRQCAHGFNYTEVFKLHHS